MSKALAPAWPEHCRRFCAAGIGMVLLLLAAHVCAQELTFGNYYYYVPEHEQYGRTIFYSRPRFAAARMQLGRTQRFRLVRRERDWFLLEFDRNGEAYIHRRLLPSLVYNPEARDPWYEFKRASVFAEHPARIEARLKEKTAPGEAPAAESKVPAWKRYKEGWNVKPSRALSPGTDGGDSTTAGTPSLPFEKKSRNKYPLLPPILSEPTREGTEPTEGASGEAAGSPGARP